jgi:hypothetical protein
MVEAMTYRMKGKVVLRRIGEDRLLVPVSGAVARENCVFPINDTGEFIWTRLSNGQTIDETAAALAAEFDVSPELAAADCRAYAAELTGQLLLEEVAG